MSEILEISEDDIEELASLLALEPSVHGGQKQ